MKASNHAGRQVTHCSANCRFSKLNDYLIVSAVRNSLLHSSSSTPPTTAHCRNAASLASSSARISMAHQFKLFKNGIDEPNTTRLMPAHATAPWHIAQGSAVV